MLYFKVQHNVSLQTTSATIDLLAGQVYIAPDDFKDKLTQSFAKDIAIHYLTEHEIQGIVELQPLDLDQFSVLSQGRVMELIIEWSNRRALNLAFIHVQSSARASHDDALISQMVDVLHPWLELMQELDLGINVYLDCYANALAYQSQLAALFPKVIIRSRNLPIQQEMWVKYDLVVCRGEYFCKKKCIPSFEECFEAIRDCNILPLQDAYDLYNTIVKTIDIPGDVAEIGVYRGASSHMIANLLQNTGKQIFLFDTFEGMPETNLRIDMHQKGGFNDTSLGQVQKFLASFTAISFCSGLFPKTLTAAHERLFSFVHIDSDIYQSTLDACHYFYCRMSHGGIMLFHDYLTYDCPGVKKAVDEFFKDKKEKPQLLNKLYCYLVKQDISIVDSVNNIQNDNINQLCVRIFSHAADSDQIRTGYQVHAISFAKALSKLCNVFFVPFTPTTIRKDSELQTLLLKGRTNPSDTHEISLAITYGNMLTLFPGNYRIGFVAFEKTKFDTEEIKQFQQLDAIFLPSAWAKNVLIDIGISDARIHVVPEGVDPSLFNPLRTPISGIVNDSAYKFLCVGKFESRKGQAELIEAFINEFKGNNDVKLLLATFNIFDQGYHDLVKCYVKRFEQEGIYNIVFINQISGDDFPGIYTSCQAFVLPTKAEGWGLPIIEAAASGLPIITTFYSAHTEYLQKDYIYEIALDGMEDAHDPQFLPRKGEHGVWAKPSIASIQEQMRYVFEHQEEARQKGLAFSQIIRTKWTWDEAARKAVEILNAIVLQPNTCFMNTYPPLLSKDRISFLLTNSSYSESHGGSFTSRNEKAEYLGFGMMYYAFVYALKAKVAVCLGSGSGFVPRLMRQAQQDLGIANQSRTILIDGNVPEAGWGQPEYLDKDSWLRQNFQDIIILVKKTAEAYLDFEKDKIAIDYLHIDADHSYEGCLSDFNAYKQLLTKKGVISFHDTKYMHTGVYKVIEHIRRLPEWSVIDFPWVGMAGVAFVTRSSG